MGTSIEIEHQAGHPLSAELPQPDTASALHPPELDLRGLIPRLAPDTQRSWGRPAWAGASLSVKLRTEALWLTLWREKAVDLSTATRRAMSQLEEAAQQDKPLLLVGEPFSGKRDAALAVHQLGARAAGPFVVWGELGDTPGDFARAIELAEGGTLYLGGVERLLPEVAQGLARAMAQPASGVATRSVRMVASSVRAHGALAPQGTLADSVLGEFSGGVVEIPPLRRRRADLPLLVERLLARIASRLGRTPPSLSSPTQKAMREYGWPGNFAELETCLAWAVLACAPSAEVQLWDLPLSVRGGSATDRSTLLSDMVGALERTAIVEALGQSGNKKIHAAATLGISRPTLDKKIAEYKIRLKRSAV